MVRAPPVFHSPLCMYWKVGSWDSLQVVVANERKSASVDGYLWNGKIV